MNIKEIQDSAPIQDERLHYLMSDDGRVVYYMPVPNMRWDAIWDARNGEWARYESERDMNRISNNRKIKPVWNWELVE